MAFINNILGYPFGIVLKLIFDAVHNYGVALILFTVFARLLMLPSGISQQKNAAKTLRLKPKLARIQEKYKGDQRKIQEETQAFYRREGANPMGGGCAPLVVPMIIMLGLVAVIYNPLTYVMHMEKADIEVLKAAVEVVEIEKKQAAGEKIKKGKTVIQNNMKELTIINDIDAISDMGAERIITAASAKAAGMPVTATDIPTATDTTSLLNVSSASVNAAIKEIKDHEQDFILFGYSLGVRPDIKHISALWLIPILSALSSMFSSLIMMRRQKEQNPGMATNNFMTGCTTFGMPLFSLYITFQFPIGIGIYWIASNLIALLQTIVLGHTHNPTKQVARLMVEETVERRSREENMKLVAEMKNNKDSR